VMDAEVSSTVEMAPRVHQRGRRSRGTWPLFALRPVRGLFRRLSSWTALRRRRKHTRQSLRGLGIWSIGPCRRCFASLRKTFPTPSR
jgi:hypothetical protein